MNQNGFENTKTKVFSVIDKSELIQSDQSKGEVKLIEFDNIILI
jgi:hypothetical protein